ncbi:MAG: hypothetical protein HDT33_10970 [Clostridiales bacterium]|nr:hypothetical protein [Clostridiales bacterium]
MKGRVVCVLGALAFGAALFIHTTWVSGRPVEGRVEVIPQGETEAAEGALARTAQEWGWELTWEGDRVIIQSESRFAAQIVQAALENQGIPAQVLDYAWAPAVLAQSGGLWLAWGALLGLWPLWSLILAQVKREWACARAALERQYPREYLSGAAVRLLAKGIGLAVGAIATILLLQWLWRAEAALPPGLLPEGSVFDFGHYRQWVQNAFPDGLCSPYGVELAGKLRLGHALAAAECAFLTICAANLRKTPALRTKSDA